MDHMVAVAEALTLVTFAGATIAAGALWQRHGRNRSSTLLFVAFLALFMAALLGRTPATADAAWVSYLSPALVMAVPALLAIFAWSFEERTPRYLAVLLILAGLPTLALLFVPLPDPDGRGAWHLALLGVYVAAWATLSLFAAGRLWFSPAGPSSVTGRLRLMAVAILALTVALFIVAQGGGSAPLTLASYAASGTAAVLFIVAFAAPPAIRRMWRSEATEGFLEVQRALIAARTSEDVYRTALPYVASLLGAEVAVLSADSDGPHLHGMPEGDAVTYRQQLVAGTVPGEGIYVYPAGPRWLVIRPTRYAPLFGREEVALGQALALHLELALERTELYEAAEKARRDAEEARKELETTVVGLAHDLRSPTVSLAGFAELLTTSDDPAEREEMSRHLISSAQYIERLVHALVEVSRVGKTQTEDEPVDLDATARRVAERWQLDQPEARIEIDRLPVARCNPSRAEQLLDNLIGNAIRHSGREDVTVAVRTQLDDRSFQIVVTDDGVGVPAKDSDNIFRLFQRSRLDGSSEGSGVGLTLVQRIAESYGGSVRLEPKTDGPEGATFVVTLPRQLILGRGSDSPPALA